MRRAPCGPRRLASESRAAECLEPRRLLAAILSLPPEDLRVPEGAGSVTITVTRSGTMQGTVGVPYRTAGPILPASAAQPWGGYDWSVADWSDYTPATGTLSFADGQSS